MSEKEFVDQINELIDYTVLKHKQALDPQTLWDLCKKQIVEKAKEYCNGKNRQTPSLEKLESELLKLQQKISNSAQIDPEILQKYNQLQLQVDLKIIKQANGAKIRSKSKWIQEGEKNTKYFLTQEKTKSKTESKNEFNFRK